MKKGDNVLIKEGVFTGFIGVVRRKKVNGDFVITLKIDYNLQDEKMPIAIQIHRSKLKKVKVLDVKDLKLEEVDGNG